MIDPTFRLPRRDFVRFLAAGGLAALLPETAFGAGNPAATFAPRRNFGAPLEATDAVIHGAGQDPDAFKNYCSVLTPATRPTIYMGYLGLQQDPGVAIRDHESQMKKAESAFPGLALIPEYGLSMRSDGHPDKHYEADVASGKYDDAIDALCRALKNTSRPAFIRIGYEFNGSWNGYQPDSYKAAFQRIAKAFSDHQVNVAKIWCVALPTAKYSDFYPGDDCVDWWGIDLFDAGDMTNGDTLDFITQAGKHNKPVIIGESTPRHVGVKDGQADWDKWFVPYFKLIHDRSEIKAFCYINWDWNKYAAIWPDWGDARVETNPTISQLLQAELNSNLYQKSPYVPSELR